MSDDKIYRLYIKGNIYHLVLIRENTIYHQIIKSVDPKEKTVIITFCNYFSQEKITLKFEEKEYLELVNTAPSYSTDIEGDLKKEIIRETLMKGVF